MRKLILILALLLSIEWIQAQTMTDVGITDTSKYLRDSIIPKTSYYVGKPLSVLLKDLKVKVKSYIGQPPFPELPDTISVISTTLEFSNFNEISKRLYSKQRTPNIAITFTKPILIPKSYLKFSDFLANWDWDSRKAAFFGNCIIAALEVRGLSPNKPPLLQNLLDTTDHH